MGVSAVELIVTQALLDRAKLLGACSDLPPVGASLDDLGQCDLAWCDERELLLADELDAAIGRSDIPLALLAHAGYGYGYGYGDGSGDGSGYGSGYSYGDGSGDGYGDGDGDGDGSGSGYSYGDG